MKIVFAIHITKGAELVNSIRIARLNYEELIRQIQTKG